MSDPTEIVVPSSIAVAIMQYRDHRNARLAHARVEQELKATILDALGYDPDDAKPVPVVAVDPNGHHMGKVTVGTWRGLDMAYFKDKYPQIYAECEMTKPTLTIREVGE